MIAMSVDSTGVLKAIKELETRLTEYSGIGKVMRNVTNAIWIPNIKVRLFDSKSTSGYEQDLDSTMYDLDPEFVDRLGSQKLRDVTEGERRGYNRGEITSLIDKTIIAQTASVIKGNIAIGVGNLEQLNQIMPHISAKDGATIWQIIHYGTGSKAGGSDVVRYGRQVFFDRRIGKGVLAQKTTNAGFKGREFFVQLDNTMHESDFEAREKILEYMRKVVKKYSYKI
jgi:hypothetical protein